MLKCIQINLGGGSGAQNLVLQTAAEKKTDILILSEFYKYGRAHERWQCDSSMRAAIAAVTNVLIDSARSADNNGFVWVTIAGIRIYSCYWSPNSTPAQYEDFLNRLEASVRASPVPVIVAGDFNAKHWLWGSPTNDYKGEALADLPQAMDLTICNQGSSPTQEKDGYQSYIDITMATTGISARVANWQVLHEETASDHRYLEFTLEATIVQTPLARGWSVKGLDQVKFKATMANWQPDGNATAEQCTLDLSATLTAAMDASAPKKMTYNNRKSVYWWSLELGRLRRSSNHLRRAYQR